MTINRPFEDNQEREKATGAAKPRSLLSPVCFSGIFFMKKKRAAFTVVSFFFISSDELAKLGI